MTIFKGYMKITKQNAAIIILYLVVFFGITLMIQSSVKSTMNDSYTAHSVKLAFVDEDGGEMAKGLMQYLEKYHQVTLTENNKEELQENMFYSNIEYIVKIPAGFEEKCLDSDEKLSVTKIPGSYTSFYVDQQINSFLNNMKTYNAAGYTVGEAVKAVNEAKEPSVTMLASNGNAGEAPVYSYYFQYIPYLLLSILCYVLGNILSAFHKPDIQKRMQASAVSARRQNMEALLAASVFGLVLWGISMAGNLILYGKEFLQSKNVPYYIINSLIMLVVALSLAYMVGMITNNTNALNGIVNILSLGMGFLCGVFVPLELLGKGVKTVAQFLPVYWYVKSNDLLAEYGSITGNVRTEILQAFGIQLVFAAAILCIAMVISKRKRLGT